jgi:RNA polymerase primary sigma factor
MPTQKTKKPVTPAPVAKKPAKTPAKTSAARAPAPTAKSVKPAPAAKPEPKARPVPASKTPAKAAAPAKPTTKTAVKTAAKPAVKETKKAAAPAPEPIETVKKKPGRPPKAAEAPATGAKRGRKPKAAAASAPADDLDMSDIEADLVGEPVPEATEKVKPLRMKISKAKERALMKEFGLDETVLSEEDMAKRRQRLKALIKLGKTRGYLTHGEISDHLPDKLIDAETMEAVITTLNDLGVAVYEQTPDAESLILTNSAPTGATEEEAEEAAEAALSTVDSEFGRTTDPVRMYMREMGTVELLTREGEIEIAKRIEGGLMAMMEAISASPATIAEILRMAGEIREGKVVISTVVDGFSNINEADDYVAEEDFDEFDEADDDDGKGGSKALTKKLEELKNQALERFDRIATLFEKVHKIYDKEGYGTPAYMKAQKALSDELMTIRFTAKTIEKLCDMVRNQVDDVRKKERELRRIIVDKCGYPQDNFIADFSGRDKAGNPAPSQLLNLKWIEKQATAGKPWSAVMGRNIPPVQDLQQKLTDLQMRVVVPLDKLKDINKRMNEGESTSRGAKKGNDRGQPAPGDLDREEIHQPRPAVPGPDPGGQHRPDEGGGQIRIPPRLQVLDLRHVVDPPGHHPLDRGPGPHHPHPGAHDRNHQQDEPHQPPAPAGVWFRARRQRAGRAHGDSGRQDPQDHEDRQGADLHGNPHRRRRRQPPGRFHRGQRQHRADRSRHAGRPARRGQGHPGQPDSARGQGAAHALRYRDVHRSHAGRGWKAVRRHPRTHPADRSQGAAEIEASQSLRQTA